VREGSGIVVEPKLVDLRAICRQVIDEVQSFAHDREFTFNCDVDGAGAWDEHRILQAISNLASNAVQHGTSGTPVHVRLTGNQDQVAVEIHNHGAIPHEILPFIFEPFRSGQHHGSRGDGLGLGLFIVKSIANAHSGGVEVNSSNGATMFRLVLPRHTQTVKAVGRAGSNGSSHR
jgi:signal transduction histidine kinase